MPFLYHITAWPFEGLLTPPSFKTEGFVHLSSAEQLLRTAQRWYAEVSEVGVLVLDQAALGPALLWEDLYDHGEAFPHLYEPIPNQSVVAVARLSRDAEGRYIWPETLRGLGSPLLDGPDPGEALIEPGRRFTRQELPALGVITYFPQAFERLKEQPGEVKSGLGSAVGPDPYVIIDGRVAVCRPGVGGAVAAVALEEMIALGCRRFVLCGGAGSLRQEQDLGHLVVVSDALRDEGLSYHYLPSAQKVATDPGALAKVMEAMTRLGVSYQTGTTWTTDALYRETPSRIARRKQQGCLTVEMEVASLLAVAQFREVPLVPVLYCGDDLSGQRWDFRDWTSAHDAQDKLLSLAIEMALRLEGSS